MSEVFESKFWVKFFSSDEGERSCLSNQVSALHAAGPRFNPQDLQIGQETLDSPLQ